MEHRGDVFDQASAAEERFLEQAKKAQAQRAATAAPDHFDGQNCTECEAAIPEGRLKLNKHTCVECQTAIEKLTKLRRPA